MCVTYALLLFALWGSACCVQYRAEFNMAGVMGYVQFDTASAKANANLTGTGTCGALNLSLSVFPVMYGTFRQPCLETHIGASVFDFSISSPVSTANVSSLFAQMSNLDALSLTVTTCDGTKSCAVVRREEQARTWRARFFTPVAGDVYFRQIAGVEEATVLADLYYVQRSAANLANVSVRLVSASSATSCDALLSSSADLAGQTTLGTLSVGSPVTAVKSRLHVSSFNGSTARYLLLHMSATNSFECAQIRVLEEKVVVSRVDMRGIKGYVMFSQACPFHTTMIRVNLTNLRGLVGPYHVHNYPLPETRSPPQSRCTNDNIGGHWNPFNVNVSSPAYPSGPGSTHDLYEVGDLSSKHGFLTEMRELEDSYVDFSLPLFGRNSIVGRSMVIHEPNGARFVCSSIGYPGAVTVGRAIFQFPVVGTVLLTQLTSNPDSDVSIFLDLSYGVPSTQATQGHNWHVHMYPIGSATDDNLSRCGTTGGHWNPFNANVTDGTYATYCRPESQFACEIGDLSSKNRRLDLGPEAGVLAAKSFFTDSTLLLSGTTSSIGRSLVIHAENGGGPRIACANLTLLRLPAASTGSWLGGGVSNGSVRFSQDSPQGLTKLSVSLSNLGKIVGGYHVHILPILSGRAPCSDDNIMGHFNPFSINTSADPLPTVGTTDEYEVGDMGGKFGLLRNLDQIQDIFMDSNMPLTGPNSVIGRSVVLHHLNGSRLQCSDVSAETTPGAEWVTASATFRGTVSGAVTMSQQIFPDGSYSDTILEVNLQTNSTLRNTEASWFLTETRVSNCSAAGGVYNPFNMTEESSTCSADSALNCVVGDLTARLGAVSLTKRQLFIDTTLQMAGDFTVIYRSLVLRQGSSVVACATVSPLSPFAQQLFPNVSSFSRHDFRNRVSNVLGVSISRITILPGSLSAESDGRCQQVTFVVSGNVSSSALATVKTSPLMGQFQESPTCNRDTPTTTSTPTTTITTTTTSTTTTTAPPSRANGLWPGEAALVFSVVAPMFLRLMIQH